MSLLSILWALGYEMSTQRGGCAASRDATGLCTPGTGLPTSDDGSYYTPVFCDGSLFHTFQDGTTMYLGSTGSAPDECNAALYTLKRSGFETSFEPFLTVDGEELRFGNAFQSCASTGEYPYLCAVDVDRTPDAVLKENVLGSDVCKPKSLHAASGFDVARCEAQSGRALAGLFKGFFTETSKTLADGTTVSFMIRQIVPYEDVYNCFAAGIYSVGSQDTCARKRPEDGTCDYSELREGTIKYNIDAGGSGFPPNATVCSKTDVTLSDVWTATLLDGVETSTLPNDGDCVDVPEGTKRIQFRTKTGVANVDVAQTYSDELPGNFVLGEFNGDKWLPPGRLKTTVCSTKDDVKKAFVSQCTIGFEGGNRWFALDPELSIGPLPSSPPASPSPSSPSPSSPSPTRPPPGSPPPSSESSTWIWIVAGVSILVVGAMACFASRYLSVDVE